MVVGVAVLRAEGATVLVVGAAVLRAEGATVLVVGAAYDREADPADQVDWQGSVRRSVEGQLARGERRREDLLHHRGGKLVPRDGALPDGAAAA